MKQAHVVIVLLQCLILSTDCQFVHRLFSRTIHAGHIYYTHNLLLNHQVHIPCSHANHSIKNNSSFQWTHQEHILTDTSPFVKAEWDVDGTLPLLAALPRQTTLWCTQWVSYIFISYRLEDHQKVLKRNLLTASCSTLAVHIPKPYFPWMWLSILDRRNLHQNNLVVLAPQLGDKELPPIHHLAVGVHAIFFSGELGAHVFHMKPTALVSVWITFSVTIK